MKKISIVIPVFNEQNYISGLLDSIFSIEYPKKYFEVIVVSDGSTDNTVSIVENFSSVRLINLSKNVGRYNARRIGAEAAIFENILFIDARCKADSHILSEINKSDEKVIIGSPSGSGNPGLGETFHDAISRLIWKDYYANKQPKKPLTRENFDNLPKGTTVFFVQKDILFLAYEKLSHIEMGRDSSDDTKLISAIVEFSPAIIHRDVKVINFHRVNMMAGLSHLYFYGKTFIDYYFTPKKHFFWLVIVFPILAILAILVGLIFVPVSILVKIITILIIDLAGSLFLAKSFREFYILLLTIPLSTIFFYSGIIVGIIKKTLKISS